jgi:protein-S-isoprenylcysteine O-methyltransferase Ste14
VSRWKKIVETEGIISAVLWNLLPLYGGSFTLFYGVFYLEFNSKLLLPLPAYLRWIGICCGILSLPFQIWIHHTLGQYWLTSLDLRHNHHLVMDVPYHWIRHPMYSQTIILLTSLSLISAHLLMMLVNIIVCILLLHLIPKEEKMLTKRFGNAYLSYVKQTGRLIPHLTNECE